MTRLWRLQVSLPCGSRRSACVLALAVALASARPGAAQTRVATGSVTEPSSSTPPPALELNAGQNIRIRFGFLLQSQADWQGLRDEPPQQNLFIRRIRFLLGGQVADNVFFFAQVEDLNLGRAAGTTKNISAGFQWFDAIFEWRTAKWLNLQGGLIRVPTSREALKAIATEFPIDFSAYAFTAGTALAATGGRDTGFLARGYFLHDRLEYRVGAFQGLRVEGPTGPFRFTTRIQYNVFDKELYALDSYPGAYLGTKKILALGAAFDHQHSYTGCTVDAYLDVPVAFGSVLGTVTWQRLDGGIASPVGVLARSQILQLEGGFYLKSLKSGSWARYERRQFSADVMNNEKRVQVGINYYPAGNRFSIKAGYGRLRPMSGSDTNQFTLQLQTYFY